MLTSLSPPKTCSGIYQTLIKLSLSQSNSACNIIKYTYCMMAIMTSSVWHLGLTTTEVTLQFEKRWNERRTHNLPFLLDVQEPQYLVHQGHLDLPFVHQFLWIQGDLVYPHHPSCPPDQQHLSSHTHRHKTGQSFCLYKLLWSLWCSLPEISISIHTHRRV